MICLNDLLKSRKYIFKGVNVQLISSLLSQSNIFIKKTKLCYIDDSQLTYTSFLSFHFVNFLQDYWFNLFKDEIKIKCIVLSDCFCMHFFCCYSIHVWIYIINFFCIYMIFGVYCVLNTNMNIPYGKFHPLTTIDIFQFS